MIKIFYVLCFLVLVALVGAPHLDREYYEYKVTKAERVCDSDNHCQYLVFTKERVFRNADSYLELKFNSSDLHGQIEEGKTYGFHTYGYRISWLSIYENIVDVKEIE